MGEACWNLILAGEASALPTFHPVCQGQVNHFQPWQSSLQILFQLVVTKVWSRSLWRQCCLEVRNMSLEVRLPKITSFPDRFALDELFNTSEPECYLTPEPFLISKMGLLVHLWVAMKSE